MTQIDEKAFEKITKTHSDVSKALWRNAIIAYEAAKAPRTITREELERASVEFTDDIRRQGGWDSFEIGTALQASLATLGITVEGE